MGKIDDLVDFVRLLRALVLSLTALSLDREDYEACVLCAAYEFRESVIVCEERDLAAVRVVVLLVQLKGEGGLIFKVGGDVLVEPLKLGLRVDDYEVDLSDDHVLWGRVALVPAYFFKVLSVKEDDAVALDEVELE